MKCVIPLAGPDFYDPRAGAKALCLVDGVPLVERALSSRPWVANGRVADRDLVFVLREGAGLAAVRAFLGARYPRAATLVLSAGTTGALASAAAGASLLLGTDEVLIVDLVDILYCCDDVSAQFEVDPALAGVVPFFESTLPKYSYLELREGLAVARTREKEVISTHASAGTYFFRDAKSFFQAAAGEFARASSPRHFVCPSFNTLIEAGRLVRGAPVLDVRPIAWPPAQE